MKKSLRTLHAIETLGIGKAERGDVRINRLEERLTPTVPFPHKHDFFQLVFVKTGKGWHDVDFAKHSVQNNQIYILKPSQVHGWELAKSTKGFVVEFTSESLKSLLTLYLQDFPDLVNWDEELLPQALFKQMETEYLKQDKMTQPILQSYLEVLLLKLSRMSQGGLSKSSSQDSFHQEFTALVEKHFRSEHSVEFYAALLKVSAKSLSARVQRLVGKSAKDIIQQRCLLEAKRLLVYSSLSISEIGYELGFEDPNYFSRFLKQNIKESAMEFRDRAKKSL